MDTSEPPIGSFASRIAPAFRSTRAQHAATVARAFASRVASAFRSTRAEIAATAACALTFTLWNASARQLLAFDVFPFFLALCFAFLIAGRLCARILGPESPRDFPTVFLFGFLALNSALFLLAWISPLSIVANSLLLMAAVGLLQLRWPPPDPAGHPDADADGDGDGDGDGDARIAVGHLALAIALIASTFWSCDSITSDAVFREGVLIKPWIDCHYHASEIRMFRDARGFSTLADLRMVGQPVWIYHHASYLVPALVSAATGTSAILAYGSFLVPAGVLLAGLAAYALVRSLWGAEAGLAAAAALLLLPDASRYGFLCSMLGYHWLQQIAPAGLYGVAIMAVAWLLMFAGCRSGRLALVALGFLTAAMAIHYKSHLFVANAFLLWIYPGVFLRGERRWWWKAAWLAFALASFFAVVSLSQRVEVVPILRLDGSAVKPQMEQLIASMWFGKTRVFFKARITPTSPLPRDLFWAALLLFYGTLGRLGLAVVALSIVALTRAVRNRHRHRPVEPEDAVFPILIIVNYLVMGAGLAFDRDNARHHPGELLHRPLVWAYFVVAAWAGGLAYRLYLDGPARRSPRLRTFLAAGVLALLVVPYTSGPGIQVGPSWGHTVTSQSYPRGWLECARYIRENADPGEVVQDSSNDPFFFFNAVCEHPTYAASYGGTKHDPELARRVEELEAFKALTDVESIRQFARRRGIRWYVLHPDTPVGWPAAMRDRPAFSWNDFRVYRL